MPTFTHPHSISALKRGNALTQYGAGLLLSDTPSNNDNDQGVNDSVDSTHNKVTGLAQSVSDGLGGAAIVGQQLMRWGYAGNNVYTNSALASNAYFPMPTSFNFEALESVASERKATIIDVARSPSLLICVTSLGDVWCQASSNAFGQAGTNQAPLNQADYRYHMQLINLPETIEGQAKRVYVGQSGSFVNTNRETVFVLTDEGEVIAWGKGQYGVGGWGDFENRQQPTLIDFPEPITQLSIAAIDNSHAVFLGESGQVYFTGNCTTHRKGDATDQYYATPTTVDSEQAPPWQADHASPIKVFAGATAEQGFTLVLCDDGSLFYAGYDTPAGWQRDPINDVTDFVTGSNINNVLLRRKSNGVWWGSGAAYANGVADTVIARDAPQPIEHSLGFIDLWVFTSTNGSPVVFAVDFDGLLWGWGDDPNQTSALGMREASPIVTPTLIPMPTLSPVVEMASLGFFDNKAFAALTEDGQLYTWGYSSYGVGASENSSTKLTPVKVRF